MNRRRFLLVSALITLCTVLVLQAKTQSGQRGIDEYTVNFYVTDEFGFDFPGATIVNNRTNVGAVSSINGIATLFCRPDDSVTVAATGYITQVINVGGRRNIHVQLQPDYN